MPYPHTLLPVDDKVLYIAISYYYKLSYMYGYMYDIAIESEARLGWTLKACQDGPGAYIHRIRQLLPRSSIVSCKRVVNMNIHNVISQCDGLYPHDDGPNDRSVHEGFDSTSGESLGHNESGNFKSVGINVVGYVIWRVNDEIMIEQALDFVASALRSPLRPLRLALYRPILLDSISQPTQMVTDHTISLLNVQMIIKDSRSQSWLHQFLQSMDEDQKVRCSIYIAALVQIDHIERIFQTVKTIQEMPSITIDSDDYLIIPMIESCLCERILRLIHDNSYLSQRYNTLMTDAEDYSQRIDANADISIELLPTVMNQIAIEAVRYLDEYLMTDFRLSRYYSRMCGSLCRNILIDPSRLIDLITSDNYAMTGYYIHLNETWEKYENQNNMLGDIAEDILKMHLFHHLSHYLKTDRKVVPMEYDTAMLIPRMELSPTMKYRAIQHNMY